jgi:uncharacterized membrane protein YoaK (UPF0700 family)
MNEDSRENAGLIVVLLVMTASTGMVDAVSFLGLGHVFTANMTGNIVLMGFRLGGASGISLSRSLIALFCFMLGAVAGGRMGWRLDPRQSRISALLVGAALLFIAAGISFKAGGPNDTNTAMFDGVVAATAMAMGLRNAVVRKLGVADLTTTVLTLTIAGLAADSLSPATEIHAGAAAALQSFPCLPAPLQVPQYFDSRLPCPCWCAAR